MSGFFCLSYSSIGAMFVEYRCSRNNFHFLYVLVCLLSFVYAIVILLYFFIYWYARILNWHRQRLVISSLEYTFNIIIPHRCVIFILGAQELLRLGYIHYEKVRKKKTWIRKMVTCKQDQVLIFRLNIL